MMPQQQLSSGLLVDFRLLVLYREGATAVIFIDDASEGKIVRRVCNRDLSSVNAISGAGEQLYMYYTTLLTKAFEAI